MASSLPPIPNPYHESMPDSKGFFGPFGGSFLPPALQEQMDILAAAYEKLKNDPSFIAELADIRKNYQGRPTPLQYAARLTESVGGKRGEVEIWLKREDLNHSGAHKLNHCMPEVLLAKATGKTKVIAETGAGQHGVALATAAAFFGLECEIHMGAVDIEKEAPNVARMKILGAKVIPAEHGLQTLKEAVDSAFEAYMKDPETQLYCIGSVVGPHPFPYMVREFQKVVGEEVKKQFEEQAGGIPDSLVASCGGGSNSIGLFTPFIDTPSVKLHAVEPLGNGSALGQHAASIAKGEPGTMHGFASIMLKDEAGEPGPVHSVASGLDYPSVGPEHAYLATVGRTEKGAGATDEETINAFYECSRKEGIIPALESAHAIAYALKLAKKAVEEGRKERIVVNLSGRGDKDMEYVLQKYGHMMPQ
ncbi:beta subunit of tryptophan synthase [Ascodesmis nigricans]|uniref:Tryptophan synthase n=1 Tax=Ascodesmis nigricans TaxID=341454 RepID=A0A4S2N2J2_9PEZI|nr:beta subunit of tryptophan synthase [Ascodesmis nigricans]